jgi:hypothetical protein
MSKEKLQKAVKYAEDLKNKLSSPVSEKHSHSPATYKQFLERELKSVTNKIDSLKLTATDKK